MTITKHFSNCMHCRTAVANSTLHLTAVLNGHGSHKTSEWRDRHPPGGPASAAARAVVHSSAALPALQQQWRVGCQPELLLIVSKLELCGHIGLHTQLIFTVAYISVLLHAGYIDCELGCLLQGTVMNIPWLADVLGDDG